MSVKEMMPIGEGMMDIIPDIDWDTFIAKAGEYQPRSVDLFSKPIGPNKSLLQTSMWCNNVFPEPQHKNVTNLQIAFGLENDPKDMIAFRELTRYNFWIGQKSYDSGPMSRFQWWNGELSEALINFCKAQELKIVGNEVEYRIGNNPIGHHILQGQFFKFQFLWDEARFCPNKDFKVVVILKGVKARGIQ